ncbi:hypothetical protein C7M84_002182 [Penaeus vannamei]|uniref:RNA-directed DNA polymerase n=1 Tax=Penaeus vannamei TaxID=6689 RepID=A0A423TRL7_PENVA|nr:hypothetical protein C7M84_002182 [Penaeus vannamei]
MSSEVARFCRSCDPCQRTVDKGRVSRAKLGRMPMITEPFQRVAVDIVGPIEPRADDGSRYILTIVDYATRYPEAIPLKNVETVSVAEALMSVFSRVGIPKEIMSDKGSQFRSDASTKFSPFELIYGHTVRGPLSLLKDLWEASERNITDETRTAYEYVINLRERLAETCKVAQEELQKAVDKKFHINMLKRYYERGECETERTADDVMVDGDEGVTVASVAVIHNEESDADVDVVPNYVQTEDVNDVHKGIEEEIERMLRLGLVEYSMSPYSTPMIAVKKKDGSNHAGLTARPCKTEIGKSSIEYLGHCVGSGTSSTTGDKIKRVLNMAVPRTKKEVRSFLGLTGYYRQYIADYATIASPLTDLTRKSVPNKVSWEICHQDAFDRLRNALAIFRRDVTATTPSHLTSSPIAMQGSSSIRRWKLFWKDISCRGRPFHLELRHTCRVEVC